MLIQKRIATFTMYYLDVEGKRQEKHLDIWAEEYPSEQTAVEVLTKFATKVNNQNEKQSE
jgi:hypothetical protein